MDLKTKRTICLVVGIASILTIVSTISYAYFSTLAEMKPVQTVINTATVSATFKDYGVAVKGSLNFGESITKKFTIENTGTTEANVKLYFKDLINTYTEESLTYTLSYAESEAGPYTEVKSKTNVPQNGDEDKVTRELSDVLSIPVGKTYYYNLVITLNYLNDVNQDEDIKAVFNTYFDVRDSRYVAPTPVTAAGSLVAKANDSGITDYNSGNKGEMFAFTHPATEQTEVLTDYRYIGSSPNNYIDFNDETWRIIGVFTVETESGNKEQLMKIIRDESIGNLTWDDYTDGSSTNEWNTASLKSLLNGEYYNTEGSFSYTYKASSTATGKTVTISKGLSSKARSQVANVKWYLGANSTIQNLGGPDYYAFERGTKTCANGCTGDYCCTGETRTTSIMQKVGLMYPSDYVYTYANGVDNKCYTAGYNCDTSDGGTPANGWLFKSGTHQWTMSPFTGNADTAFYVFSYGYVYYGYVYSNIAVRPTVFLASDVAITSGDGSSSNHYKLG